MRSLLLAASACLVCTSQSAIAQGPTPFVSAAQKALESYVAGRQLTLLPPIQVDAIGEDEDSFFDFEVPASADLSVRAACNSDCDDIDLEVYDSASGRSLGSDTKGDATPEVTLSGVGNPRKLEVRVKMSSCSEDTCSIAVGVYEK